MLPKRSRLSAADVRQVIKAGRSARGAGISAKYEPASSPQVAVVISKKVAHGAVERNRLRRLVYRSLPATLPRARVVLFVQSAKLDPEAITTLCSQLS
ncbi:MAG: ribonuclease P protein component [Candidatus Pacebacteria bacterium]|nr:ribonuclease P protein component [Candidatus Paceibacterota bacterium]